MKILLVYPRYPDTFWSFRHALKFISKKASFPPLGLLTIAAMMPAGWSQKLVDMNVADLTDEDIKWADYVYLSAMVVQADSAKEIIARSQGLGTAVVAGAHDQPGAALGAPLQASPTQISSTWGAKPPPIRAV